MPKEATVQDFEKLKEKAKYFVVVKRGDKSKLKIRTRSVLYTIKLKEEEIEKLLKNVKAEVKEF
jgi:hypothetical protein